MALTTTEQILNRAEGGEKLNSEDRRRCIAYLSTTKPDMSNVDMAQLFKVHESLIRKDKKVIRKKLAKEVNEEDVSLVIVDISQNFIRQLRDLEASKAKCKLGSRDYVSHCTSLFDLELKKVRALQDLGFLPKNLGTIATEKFEYLAIITKGDQIESKSIEHFDEDIQNKARKSIAGEVIDIEVLNPESEFNKDIE